MPRFFISSLESDKPVFLTGKDAHHARDVLRLRAGETVWLSGPAGREYTCQVAGFPGDAVELAIISDAASRREPPYRVTLYQGLPKGDKMDRVVQMAVELGASGIVPVLCRRSVVLLSPQDARKKTERWNRIAEAAAKQCGRGCLPRVSEPVPFAAAAAEAGQADIRLLPWEEEQQTAIRELLEACPDRPAAGLDRPLAISVVIGPEGGLEADEVSLALRHGLQPLTLGRRILRTETAGAAVLAMLLYRFDRG
jgi:16S rRNA (uracil1498-N3)-methyltransferase